MFDGESDGLGMQPRAKEPESPWVVPGMGVPPSAPEPPKARDAAVQPQSIQFPPLIPDTSSPFPQPPGIALQEPAAWQYDFTALDGVTGISRATYPGMVNFSASQSTPTIPVSVAQGGTGQTSFANGMLTANGGAIQSLATPTKAMWVGNSAGQWAEVTIVGGANPITDNSPANFGTLGTMNWMRLGSIVMADFALTYPSNSDSVNNAQIGNLPYPTAATIATWFGTAGTNGYCLFNATATGGQFLQTSTAPFHNNNLSGVTLSFTVVYFTNAAP